MTTIAYDGKSVAADGQKVFGTYRSPHNHEKLREVKGVVFAITGCAALQQPMIDWYLFNNADPELVPKVPAENETALIVFRDGKAEMYKTNQPYPEELHAPDAWGAGAEFAIGAMKAGADARRSVEIAIECNPQTGGEVQVIDLLAQTQRETA